MIGDTLTSFIEGRNILDGVAIAQEVIYQCRKTDTQGYLLKLDFEKIYDKVELACIIEILRNRGFGSKWINWITIWLHSTKIFILTNWVSGNEIV